jgi:NodT family efflux transporter outer membrane factor (OMF) lipoprotein
MRRYTYVIITVMAGVCGCNVGPDYKRPDTKMPATFRWADPNNSRPGMPEAAAWWTRFNDEQLNCLIADASSQNLDLRIARARITEARAIRGIVAADEMPKVNVTEQATRQRVSKNSVFGGFPNFPLQYNDFQAGFDARWELDLFGGTRRAVQAAEADIDAAGEARNNVLISVISEVARNYVELRGYQRRLEVTYQNLKAQNESLDIAKDRFKAGLTSELNVAQARAQVASTESQVPVLETGIGAAINRLGVLTGRQPGELKDQLSKIGSIPLTELNIPVGMPSEILRRRPDVRQAERELAASTARIGAATADLFPKFSLTGNVGLESMKGHNLFEYSSRYWTIGQGISWPIFDAGRIRANIKVQNARQEQALANYEKTVLTSLEDVENSLIAYGKEQRRRDSLQEAERANQKSLDLANELYKKGLVDFLNVLDAERALYNSQDQLAQSQKTVATNLIALYKSLGGGWQETGFVIK